MKRYCRNCYHPLPYKGKFCAHCGQKDSDGQIRMSTMLRKLWDTTFHLEGKFLRTSWQLFVPGLVTREFFKGKQDRYPHPIRLFAIVMFLFLFLLNSMLNDATEKGDKRGIVHFDGLSVSTEGDTARMSGETLFEKMKHRATMVEMWKDYESLPPEMHSPQARRAVDSLLKIYSAKHSLQMEGLPDSIDKELDTMRINLFQTKIRLATLDIVRYDTDEIIRRYGITNWFDKMLVRQGIKSLKTPDALGHAYVGSLTWTLLVLVSFMSLVLALLYRRQRRYYLEHFIFLLHFHTGVMLALLLAIIGVRLELFGKVAFAWLFAGISLAMYFALRRFYGQGGGKTFVKWLIFGVLYFFAFIILFLLGILVVFAVF